MVYFFSPDDVKQVFQEIQGKHSNKNLKEEKMLKFTLSRILPCTSTARVQNSPSTSNIRAQIGPSTSTIRLQTPKKSR